LVRVTVSSYASAEAMGFKKGEPDA